MSQFDFNKSHFLASPETVLVKTNLDRVVGFMSEFCQTPFAAISTGSDGKNSIRASIGLDGASPDFIESICEYSLKTKSFTVRGTPTSRGTKQLPDTLSGIQFYAGAVLRRANGSPFGTLCIWDYRSRALSNLQKDAIKLCAQHASQHIELSRLLSQSRNKNELLKPEELEKTTEDYWQNFEDLTPREKQVLHAILENTGDSSNKRLAQILDISPRTVELHRARVFAKMHVRSAAELVALSLKSDT